MKEPTKPKTPRRRSPRAHAEDRDVPAQDNRAESGEERVDEEEDFDRLSSAAAASDPDLALSEDAPSGEGGSSDVAGEKPEPPSPAMAQMADAPTMPASAPQPSEAAPESAGQERPEAANSDQYHIYIIDSGWNSVARKVLNDNLPLFHDMTRDDPAYVLDRETSADILRRHRHLIGRDPIICVHDVGYAGSGDANKVRGCRAHLGLLRDEKAVLQTMQMFARLLAAYRNSDHLETVVRRRLRREGVAGAIEVIVNRGGHS